MSEAASESTPADTNAPPTIDSRIVALRNQVGQLDGPATGTDLVRVPGVDPDSAVELKTAAADQRALANSMSREVKAMEQAIRAKYEAQLAEMRTLMAPIQEKMAQATEVIATLNLYLGRDEEIIPLADGEPAPASSPLTVRQMVLSMDEETALYSDEGGVTGGMDFTNLTDFDQWLLSDPAHLQQILPEQRGVVALVPRRRGKDYQDPWMNKAGAEKNVHTYWLIRNGEKLWRMDTELDVGMNLVPARDEFTGLFRVKKFNYTTRQDEWHDLVPGSSEWMSAEKAQGARQRHFFRIALILQGLIDRTKIFYPLPDGGISLLHPESYESGKAVMLADGERTLQSSRKPFYEWLKDLNSQLRPGMRFIGAFGHDGFRGDWVDDHDRRNRRVTPKGASAPRDLSIHQIDKFENGKLVFKYDRTDMVWTADGDYRAPKTRASAWVYPSDRFVLPIDLVDSDTMRSYLTARTERHAYLDSFALLKRGIAIKDEEAALEAPFREYLASSVAAELQLELDTVRAGIGAVIDWWKLGNKWHRPLVKGEDPAAEAKAARMITAEYKARLASATGANGNTDAKAVQILRALDPSIMFIGRRHSGGYLAFAPQPRKYGKTQGLRDDLWVTEYTLTGAKGKPSKREWVLAGPRGQKTAPLFESDAWAKWDTVSTNYREHLTDGDVDDLLEEFMRCSAQHVRVDGHRTHRNVSPVVDPAAEMFAVALSGEKGAQFKGWMHSPALVEEELRLDSSREPKYLLIRASWEKDTKGRVGFAYDYRDWSVQESSRWSGSAKLDDPTSHPWCHVWDGRVSGTEALVEFSDPYAKYRAFAADVQRHNNERHRKADLVNAYLWNVEKVAEQKAIDTARERYLEDYSDPEGWEDHRKTIKIPSANIRRGYSMFGAKHPLEPAVAALVTSGATIEGRTVRDVMEKSGATAQAMEQIETEGIADIVLTSGKG